MHLYLFCLSYCSSITVQLSLGRTRHQCPAPGKLG
jgi:hypothetical protein